MTAQNAGHPAGHEGLDAAREAAQGRENAARELLEHPPELPRGADELARFVVETSDEATRELARRWLTDLGRGPDAALEPAQWWREVMGLRQRGFRAEAAFALAVAYRETRIRSHPRWDFDDVTWVLHLAERCGYEWTDWETLRFCEHFGVATLHDDRGGERPGSRLRLVTMPLPARITELTAEQAAALDLGECRAEVTLGNRDLTVLNSDPLGVQDVHQSVSCVREADHAGEHTCSLQTARARYLHPYLQPRPWDEQVEVWVWWSDDGSYRFAPADHCQAPADAADPEAEDYFCHLPADHPGPHLFTVFTDDPPA